VKNSKMGIVFMGVSEMYEKSKRKTGQRFGGKLKTMRFSKIMGLSLGLF